MASVSEDPKPTGTPAQEIKQDNVDNEGKTNLIINYLPQHLTDKQFHAMFTTIGPIKASKIVRHRETGYSYGYGFIDYQDAGDAARAIKTLNGLQVLHKRIKVSYARPGGEKIKGAKLYVRGIPKDYPLEQAEKVFANFGKVIQFRVIEQKSGADKRLAFVLYNLHENAEAAMGALTGTTLPGANEQLVIEYAQPKSKKRKHSGATERPANQLMSALHGASGRGSKPQFEGKNGTAVSSGQMLFVHDIGTEMDESSL